MDSFELIDFAREELFDQSEPYLWSDTALFRYLDDAQKMFCRLTDGIEDATTQGVTEIAVTAPTEWFSLHKSVLKVRTATHRASGRGFDLVPAEKALPRGIVFDGRAGPTRAIVTGLEKGKLRLWPVPVEDFYIDLRVFRLPLTTITEDAPQALEIDEQHHLALIDWVKYHAYRKQDAETYDQRKADRHQQQFMAYCEKAKKEQGRARHDAGAVMYGGI